MTLLHEHRSSDVPGIPERTRPRHARAARVLALPGSARITPVLTFAQGLEARTPWLRGRSERIAAMCERLAARLGVGRAIAEATSLSARLHDVGNASVPGELLAKAGALRDDERAAVRAHVLNGAQMLREAGVVSAVCEIVESHHERWDGTGYPFRTAGEQIPIGARILAVADVFDALCSERPYRAAYERHHAVHHIIGERGRHFDPAVVDASVSLGGTR